MRLYTFEADGHSLVGVEREGRLLPLPQPDMLALIQGGEAALAGTRQIAATAPVGSGYALESVRVRAPIGRPGKMLASGINYRGHLDENPGAVLPETPGFFVKLSTAIIGPGDPIVYPAMTAQLDYEVELSVVIGKRLRKAPESAIMESIFGYTIMHDVSARDIQFKAPMPNQITLGKNFDSFAPLGPCIVTADELQDLSNIQLRTILNGMIVQDSSTSDWLFPLPFLLSFTSQIMTLEPGDIVTTGTPAGCGAFRKPQLWMKPGDLVVVEVEGIGRLENPVVAEE